VERAKIVRRGGTAELVHAVEQGEVSVSAAAAFVRDHQPATQNEYIAHADSVAEAVKTAIAEMRAAESAIPNRASGDVKEKATWPRGRRRNRSQTKCGLPANSTCAGSVASDGSFVTPMATASR
jgi:hypothetical protein